MEGLMIKTTLVALAILAAASARYVFHLQKDNFIEHLAEEVIRAETGQSVDFSVNKIENN